MFLEVIKQAVSGRFNLPIHLILHVTYRCNLQCQTCFNWKNLNIDKKDLTIDEFLRISQSLKKILWFHISGGEPFLRDDLPDICEIFARNNQPSFISIPTNGFNPERIEKIGAEILLRCNSIPIAIDLALDDLGEKHDVIRGRQGSFDNLLESYKVLMRLRKRFSHLSTKVTTVISNKNFDNLETIVDFVYNKMKGISFHTLIFMRGNPRNPDLHLPSLEKIEEKKCLLLFTWEKYGFDINLSWPERIIGNAAHRLLLKIYLQMMKENKRHMSCLAGSSHAVIGADGEVSFCELLGSIGNLREYSFDFGQLWKTSKAQEMRRFIENKFCWCTHGCVFMDNIFLNMKNYPVLIKDILVYAPKIFGIKKE